MGTIFISDFAARPTRGKILASSTLFAAELRKPEIRAYPRHNGIGGGGRASAKWASWQTSSAKFLARAENLFGVQVDHTRAAFFRQIDHVLGSTRAVARFSIPQGNEGHVLGAFA